MASQFISKSENFYKDGAKYWSEIPATVNGMLGGFASISTTDIQGSRTLLKQLFNSNNPPGRNYALDCGAGIGRITKFLLTNLFDKVDLVEQNAAFLHNAKSYLGTAVVDSKIGRMFPVGLQNFQPASDKYDVIWIQWVSGHLTDDDLIRFLKKCQEGLKHNGVIVLKENVTSSEEIEIDEKDSSITRPMGLIKEIIDKSNLDCYRMVKQLNFPHGLYNVYMFVLKLKIDVELFESR